MRFFPILAAIVASAAIYAFVFERDRLMSALTPTETAGPAVPAPAAGAGSQPETESKKPVGVVVMKSEAQMIDTAVILRGRTEADRQADLRAETTGQVVSAPLRKGRHVETGDVLCKLDPGPRGAVLAETRARLIEAKARVPEARARVPEADARLDEARARVTEAQSRLEEARINANAASKLSEDGFASDTRVAATEAAVRGAEAAVVSATAGLKSAASGLESVAAGIETAKAGVEAARAAVAAAEREIERLTITAPFGGVLENDTAELGSLLQPGALCATVIQLDPIILVGFVPETDVDRVAVGAPARARLVSGRDVRGEVVFVSRAADPDTRTFRVEIKAPNPDLTLRDGQTAEIVIAAEGKRAHLLPQSALTLNDAGDMGVRVVAAGDRVEFLPVTLLRDTTEGVWLAGLPEQADVIVIGQEYVTDGVRVAATFREASE